MKILQVAKQFHPSIGGLENSVYGLTRALHAKNCYADVVTLDRLFTTGKKLPQRDRIDGLDVYRIPFMGMRRYPFAPKVLNFLAPYDLIHVHGIEFFVDFLALTRPIHEKPIVVTTHGGFFHTQWLMAFKRFYFNTLTRSTLSKTDAVVCVSDLDYRVFRGIVPEDKLHTILNGVDTESFSTTQKQITPGLLVGIGRICDNKRIDRMIDLLPLLAKRCPTVKFVWIGPDSDGQAAQLMRRAQNLGVANRVEFLGSVSQHRMNTLLSQAHCFVSSAQYEAFGISTIEAMSSATVPVVSPVGIHSEIVIPGETGFICPFEHYEQAYKTFDYIFSLDSYQLQQIGLNARRISQQYSWNKAAEQYYAVYKSVLQDSRIGAEILLSQLE